MADVTTNLKLDHSILKNSRAIITILIVSVIVVWSTQVSGDLYCVKPIVNATCPEACLHCDTLSKYAAQPDGFFALNTSLLLQSGTHNLDKVLTITNIDELYLYHSNGTTKFEVTITCTNHSELTLKNIGHVRLRGLKFFSCTNNQFNSVSKINLEDCTFNGQGGKNLIGVTFSNITLAEISRSSFVSHDVAPAIAFFSDYSVPPDHSMIVLRACTFSNNNVATGSVNVFGGKILIYDSYFSNNTASSSGGVYFSDFSYVVISNCTFANNYALVTGAAVGGSNTEGTVLIENSRFISNGLPDSVAGAVYIFSEHGGYITINNCEFMGNRGAVAAAIRTEGCEVLIQNSTFYENTASHFGQCGAVLIDSVTGQGCSIRNSTFFGNDGGALCVSNCLEFEMIDTLFVNNSADVGGAFYVISTPSTFDGKLVFVNNSAIKGAAMYFESSDIVILDTVNVQSNTGLTSMVHAVSSSITVPLNSSWTITDNVGSLYIVSSTLDVEGYLEIRDNSQNFGSNNSIIVSGVITTYQSVVNFSGIVVIEGNNALNGGGILAAESTLDFYHQVTIANNTALQSGGGIYAYQSELNFNGEINITKNEAYSGGGIQVIGSTAKVLTGGFVYISNNNATKGGGMSLQQNSKLYIIKSQVEETFKDEIFLKLKFENNNADYGGALYVFDDTTSGGCALVNTVSSECFFQAIGFYSEAQPSNRQYINLLNTFFYNNTATTMGATLHGGLLDRCKVSPFAEIFLKYDNLNPATFTNIISYIVNVTNIPVQDIHNTIASNPVRVCFCKQNSPDCSYVPPPLEVTKGKMFTVRLVAVDQVNNSVDATIHSSLEATDGAFIEKQISYTISSTCTDVEYSTLSSRDIETLILYAEGPCYDIGVSGAPLRLKYKPCPIGFTDRDMKCDCDEKLYPKLIQSCSINNETVRRKNNVWFSYENESDHQRYIYHNHCPFSYCHPPSESIHIDLNLLDGSDALCISNRSGKLCGSCEEGLSLVFGSSRCRPCSNHWLALILVFVIAGIALVAFLLLFNLTISVGTIGGLIFYANIFAANRQIFLPNAQPGIDVFISWINLDFGFETCFYDGMDGYAKTWLQFAFPLYILSLVIAVIEGCHYSTKIANLLVNRNPVQTLATLIYLSYAKLLRTIIAALSLTVLEYSDGSREIVWLYDANIRYLEGKHIPLFIAAMVVVIAGLFYTSLLFFWQWLVYYSKWYCFRWASNTKLIVFMRAYHAPYNKNHRYWIGLLPLACTTLYLVSAVNVFGDPHVNLLSINSLVVCLLFYQLVLANYGKVGETTLYEKRLTNVLENSFFLNLIALTSITYYLTTDSNSDGQIAVTYTSITVALVTFLAILSYHAWMYALKPLQQKWNKRRNDDNDNAINKNSKLREVTSIASQDRQRTSSVQIPSETVVDCGELNTPLISPTASLRLSQEWDQDEDTSHSYGAVHSQKNLPRNISES